MRITKIEKKYIELIYLGVTDYKDLEKELKRSKKKISQMETRIFKVLESNSWYNVIRKSFELNILNKGDFRELNIENEINKTVLKIKNIKQTKHQEDVDIKLEIFDNLVALYNKREYDILLRQLNPVTEMSVQSIDLQKKVG